MNTKTCIECKIEKDISLYYHSKYRSDNLSTRCIECSDRYAPPEKIKRLLSMKVGQFMLSKPIDFPKPYKICTICNTKKLRKEFSYGQYNPDGKLTRCKKCVEKARINHNISDTIRKRIGGAIVAQRTNKAAHSIELLGCTIQQARDHLEALFLPGMTWDNHGFYGWHIDHIRPCASFDLTDPAQQHICFHYTNLQPLWARDNLVKGCKYIA